MKRYLAFAFVVGLVVGAVFGSLAGHNAGYYKGRDEVTEQNVDMSEVLNGLREQAASDVRVGMTASEAETIIKREGYKPEINKSDKNLWRWSKPWRHGFQYVNIRFKDDRVVDVSNLWIDT